MDRGRDRLFLWLLLAHAPLVGLVALVKGPSMHSVFASGPSLYVVGLHAIFVVAHAAGVRGVDGVVCGHIHTAEMRDIAGVAYYNDGDWVEGCTALVEHFDGRMELLHWADEIAAREIDNVVTLAA